MTTKVLMQIFGPLVSILVVYVVSIRAEQCLPGEFHKNISSPANEEYAQCQAWSKDTCCTADFAEKLNKTQARDLYGFHWGHCKNISKVYVVTMF